MSKLELWQAVATKHKGCKDPSVVCRLCNETNQNFDSLKCNDSKCNSYMHITCALTSYEGISCGGLLINDKKELLLLCPTHFKRPIYCVCKSAYDDTGKSPMISCDSCSEWYHFNCLGLRRNSKVVDSRFTCDNCKTMTKSKITELKRNNIIKERDDISIAEATENMNTLYELEFMPVTNQQAFD
jgi:hypothetical protein